MNQELPLRIILQNPLVGVDFGLQKGSGTNYQTLQKQRATDQNLPFEYMVMVKYTADNQPDFAGTIVQGTPANRFIYIGIGTSVGQFDSVWRRRLKIPLKGITAKMVNQIMNDPALILETKVPGTGKDGGPNCGTVKPFNGWWVAKK